MTYYTRNSIFATMPGGKETGGIHRASVRQIIFNIFRVSTSRPEALRIFPNSATRFLNRFSPNPRDRAVQTLCREKPAPPSLFLATLGQVELLHLRSDK